MGTFSIWHWLIVLFVFGLIGYPIGRIVRRTGNSPLWAVFFFVPIANLLALWVLAFVRWPSTDVQPARYF